jgi:tetratricopeptide (TPR) repeat protein
LTGPRQVMWLNQLEEEHDNLRAALEWLGQKTAVEKSLRLGGALWRFWVVRGHLREGQERLSRLLELAGASVRTEARAKVLTGAGTLAHNRGEYALARALFEESLAIWRELGDKAGSASALNNLGWMGWRLSEYAAGRAYSEESLALYRELGDTQGIAAALNNLGWLAHHQGDYQAARSYHEGSLALRRELEDKRGIAFSLTIVCAEATVGVGTPVVNTALRVADCFTLNDAGRVTEQENHFDPCAVTHPQKYLDFPKQYFEALASSDENRLKNLLQGNFADTFRGRAPLTAPGTSEEELVGPQAWSAVGAGRVRPSGYSGHLRGGFHSQAGRAVAGHLHPGHDRGRMALHLFTLSSAFAT